MTKKLKIQYGIHDGILKFITWVVLPMIRMITIPVECTLVNVLCRKRGVDIHKVYNSSSPVAKNGFQHFHRKKQ